MEDKQLYYFWLGSEAEEFSGLTPEDIILDHKLMNELVPEWFGEFHDEE